MINFQYNLMGEKRKNRIDVFDIYRGIAILSILVAHLHWNSYVRSFFFSFHLPLFFIISGIFIQKSADKYNFWPYLWNKFNKILIPFLIAIGIQFLYHIVISDKLSTGNLIERLLALKYILIWGGSSDSLYNGIYSIYLWFLPPFFLASISLFVVFKYFRRYLKLFFIGFAILSFIFYFAALNGYYSSTGLFWGVDKIPMMIVFAMLGHFFSDKLEWIKRNRYQVIFWGFIVLLASSVLRIDMRSYDFSSVLLFYLSGTIGFGVVYSISTIIDKYKEDPIRWFLVLCGSGTMLLYIIQSFTFPIVHQLIGSPVEGVITKRNIAYNLIALATTFFVFTVFKIGEYYFDKIKKAKYYPRLKLKTSK